MGKRIVGQDFQRRHMGQRPQPEKVAAWRQAVDAGLAEAFCDRIISTWPVPEDLLRALL